MTYFNGILRHRSKTLFSNVAFYATHSVVLIWILDCILGVGVIFLSTSACFEFSTLLGIDLQLPVNYNMGIGYSNSSKTYFVFKLKRRAKFIKSKKF